MGLSYRALYQDLLQDLSGYLPNNVRCFNSATMSEYYPGMTRKQFAALHLAKSFLKKFQDVTSPDADTVALSKFQQSNVQCWKWSLRLESLEDELLVGLFKQEVYRFLNPSKHDSIVDSFEQIMQFASTGPGSSMLARGNDFYTKLFDSPLSTTSEGLYRVYWNYFKHAQDWNAAEKLRLANHGEPVVVEGNRLSFVPKNADTSRVICTEPSLNMFFQLGLGHLIRNRLRQFFGIDLSTQQDVNRDLAQVGSVTDDLCTIDLSSASDTVSHRMVKEMFPRDFVAWLDFCRSPKCQLPDGRWEELYMVSSMGNGFTFPLESMIFACAVAAAYYADDLRLDKTKLRSKVELTGGNKLFVATKNWTHLGNFGVYGDDIIVERRAYRKTVRLLELLGFQVNHSKSFIEGPFRESCGGDFFKGHPVRGVYIKSLETPASRYVAINRLNLWSAVNGIDLPKTVSRLVKSVRWLPVPLYEDDDAGVKVPHDVLDDRTVHANYQSEMYRRWQAKPKVMKIGDGAITVPRKAKSRAYNPSGLFVTFLRGDIENSRVSIRLGAPTYYAKWAVSPNWNWLPTVGVSTPIDWRQLATAVRTNLPW